MFNTRRQPSAVTATATDQCHSHDDAILFDHDTAVLDVVVAA
jgi:hypothetical protein